MADNERERQWIVEPPERGEVALHLAFGDGVQLTAEQEAALGELLRTLEAGDPEVTGLSKCKPVSSCITLACSPVSCQLRCGTLKAKLSEGTGWSLMGSFGTGLQ